MERSFTSIHRLSATPKKLAGIIVLTCSVGGCVFQGGIFKAAGEEGQEISELFTIMSASALIIWGGVFGALVVAIVKSSGSVSKKNANYFIIGCGVIFPTLALAVLLVFGLRLLPGWEEDTASVRIHVHAEQWWWRVRYEIDGVDAGFEEANEIHLPTGETVEFVLSASEVIHSFWIPAIGGKLDMIPGRTTRLRLTPTRPGTYTGTCAEYCGASHARMKFTAVVHKAENFRQWLDARKNTRIPLTNSANSEQNSRGEFLFLSSGCGGCHTIQGISEKGNVGPDLSRIGNRETIAAGTLPNTAESLAKWIRTPRKFKPEVQMPGYPMLSDQELLAIGTFLTGLK